MILNAASGCQAGTQGNIGKINTWCLGQTDRKIRIIVRFFFFPAASRTRMCDETFPEFIFGT